MHFHALQRAHLGVHVLSPNKHDVVPHAVKGAWIKCNKIKKEVLSRCWQAKTRGANDLEWELCYCWGQMGNWTLSEKLLSDCVIWAQVIWDFGSVPRHHTKFILLTNRTWLWQPATFRNPRHCLHCRAISGASEMPEGGLLLQACAEYSK